MSYQEPYENDIQKRSGAQIKYKIVTLCRGGQVRSVGLKYILHYKYGHDVIACGWESNSEETRKMLYEWADYIILMQPEFEKYVPENYKQLDSGARKLICYDVGEDRYGYAFHPELQKMLDQMIIQHGVFNK